MDKGPRYTDEFKRETRAQLCVIASSNRTKAIRLTNTRVLTIR